MSREGFLTSMEVEGAIDGDAIFVFLEHFLGPCLRPGDVVLMGNLSTHKSVRMSEAIHAHGAEVVFLPRYSTDFNPIAGAWSKLKAYLRKVAARTPKALDRARSWSGADQREQRTRLVQKRGLQNRLTLTSNRKTL